MDRIQVRNMVIEGVIHEEFPWSIWSKVFLATMSTEFKVIGPDCTKDFPELRGAVEFFNKQVDEVNNDG